uniref:Uncharacterized protein n=1 Tax=Anguilla anguilla TaxID=7936 RepID=A0A0E9PGS9_ANGAN
MKPAGHEKLQVSKAFFITYITHCVTTLWEDVAILVLTVMF